jgi:hypothetical protein
MRHSTFKFITAMVFSLSLLTFASSELSASDQTAAKSSYAIILSGGLDLQNNHPRYFENVRAMYDAFRSTGIPSDHITVLYGSGRVEDTRQIKEDEPQFPQGPMTATITPVNPPQQLVGGPMFQPGAFGQVGPNGQPTMPTGAGMQPGLQPGYGTGYGYAPNPSNQGNPAARSGFPMEPPTNKVVPAPNPRSPKLNAPGPTTSSNAERPSSEQTLPPQQSSYSNPASELKAPSAYTLSYLFGGEKREIDGAAKLGVLRQKLREIRSKLKGNEDITLFITDHGGKDKDEGGTRIELWGESITVEQLGELLREFPDNHKIRLVTNICYGGGLAELTSSNVCVVASQQPHQLNRSMSEELNLYGQNFPFAIRHRLDADKDGKSTLMDAHIYASAMDSGRNIPYTSIDWLLAKNRNKILDAKRQANPTVAPLNCPSHPDAGLKNVVELIEDYERLKEKIKIDTDGISEDRRRFLKGRIEMQVKALQGQVPADALEMFDTKLNILKSSLAQSAQKWDRLSAQEKNSLQQRAILEAQEIARHIDGIEKNKKAYELLNAELDFLKYADDSMMKDYQAIRGCLDYAY